VRSGPGAARTILLSNIISDRPPKQPLIVCTFLKVYMELGSYFLFLQEQIKDTIIINPGPVLPIFSSVPVEITEIVFLPHFRTICGILEGNVKPTELELCFKFPTTVDVF
jgi:hypothetical protein